MQYMRRDTCLSSKPSARPEGARVLFQLGIGSLCMHNIVKYICMSGPGQEPGGAVGLLRDMADVALQDAVAEGILFK